jgi:hypothetical protein
MRRLCAVLFIVLAVLGFGCGGGGNGVAAEEPTLRVLNASPDSTALEFWLNDDIVGTAYNYLQSSPVFGRIASGFTDVRIRESATTPEVWAEVVNFQNNRHYLLVAAGLMNYGTEFEKRVRLTTVEVNRAAPNGNRARVYVLHDLAAAPGFQTPQIDFQDPGQNPQFKVEEIDFASTKELQIDSGTYTMEARRTGTEDVLVSQSLTFGAGKIYIAVVGGQEGGVGQLTPQITLIELQPK